MEYLATQLKDFTAFLHSIAPAKRLYRYAEDKWSVQEMLRHMTDTERIFAYRALRIARGDQTPLPGFEQHPYVPASEADAANWDHLVKELSVVRESTMALLRFLPQAACRKPRGCVWGRRATTRSASAPSRGYLPVTWSTTWLF